MNSLLFILFSSLKNFLIKARKIILITICTFHVFAVIYFFNRMQGAAQEANATIDMSAATLHLILFILFTVISFVSFMRGLSRGGEIFKQEDTNHLFTAPITPSAVILFAFIKFLKKHYYFFLLSFFMGYSFGAMANAGFLGTAIIIIGSALTTCITAALAVCIFMYSSGRPLRRIGIKAIAFFLFSPPIIYVLWKLYIENWGFSSAVDALIQSPVFIFTPISGWASTGIVSFILGNYLAAVLFFGILILLGLLLFCMIMRYPYDYENTYSDFEVQIKERRAGRSVFSIKGKGALVLFFKQTKEIIHSKMFSSKKEIFSKIVMGVAYCFLIICIARLNEYDMLLYFVIIFMLTSITNDKKNNIWDEMSCHYIFMLPESPLKKLIYGNISSVCSLTINGTIAFIIVGVIGKKALVHIIAVILLYFMYVLMLSSIDLLFFRITGKIAKGFIRGAFRLAAVTLFMLPSVAAAWAILGIAGRQGYGIMLALLILIAWEFFVACICFALSKDILHNGEMIRG